MNVLGISGSATGGSSTDLIVRAVLEGASRLHAKTRFKRLNEMKIMPCQACGRSPEPDFCFFHDDTDELYNLMKKSQGIVLGSPIYFDSVSAQTKLFIDRANCLRPADFSISEKTAFKRPLFAGKKGGIVIVGGERGSFDTALRTARAFFIWAGIQILFELKYATQTMRVGDVANDQAFLKEARQRGTELANAISRRDWNNVE